MRWPLLDKDAGGTFRITRLTISGSCNRDQGQDPIHADRGGVRLFLGLFNRLAVESEGGHERV